MSAGDREFTAVFACELHDDLGYGAPLLCVAEELGKLVAERGCRLRTAFVVSDPVYCGAEVALRGHAVLPAPTNKRPYEIHSQAKSYANTLAAIGFGHERELKLMVQAWDRVFALLSPDVIIADSSPLACMAARGRFPLMLVGSGFGMPPPDLPVFPPVTRDGQSETNQALLLEVANNVLSDRGVATTDFLPGLFKGDRRAVFTVPQLDPYHAHRNETLLGSSVGISGPLAPRDGPSIFFSLPSALSCLSSVVRALERVGATISCYVPGPTTVATAMLRQIGAHIYKTRPDLELVLSDAAVVLAASPDLATAAYLAGRPQVVLRSDPETSAMASELERRQTAIALELARVEDLTEIMRELLQNTSYAKSAREEARRSQSLAVDGKCAVVAARECLELFMH